jgi:hypothetical protein
MLGKLIKLDFRMMRSHLKWTIPIYALLLTSAFVFLIRGKIIKVFIVY